MTERSHKPSLTPLAQLETKQQRPLEEDLMRGDMDRNTRLHKPELHFEFFLPEYLDTTLIGIDIAAIERLCQIAGIAKLHITAGAHPTSQRVEFISHRGESTTMEALGMIIQSANATLQPHSATQVNVYINMNIEELQKKVWELNTPLASSEQEIAAWSHVLQAVLRKQLRVAAQEHLIHRLNLAQLITMMEFSIIMIVIALQTHSVESVAQALVLATIIAKILDTIAALRTKHPFRNSAFYGPEFDRALWFRFASARRALIGVIPENTLSESERAALERLTR